MAKYKVSREELDDLREMIEHDELPDSGNVGRLISRYGVMSEWD